MHRLLTVAVLTVVVGLVGCKKKSPPPLVHVPPPEPVENESFSDFPEIPAASEPIAYPEPVPAPAPRAAAPTRYTIQRGDTLWSISERVYRDGQRWREILAANPGLEPTKMRVGQVIVLP